MPRISDGILNDAVAYMKGCGRGKMMFFLYFMRNIFLTFRDQVSQSQVLVLIETHLNECGAGFQCPRSLLGYVLPTVLIDYTAAKAAYIYSAR